NNAYLRDQLIPTLVERHFTSDKDGALHVAVRGAQNVIFSTPDAGEAVLKTPDVVEPLWDIRFFEYNRFVAERGGTPPPSPPPPPPPPSPRGATRHHSPPFQVLYTRDDRPHDRDRGDRGDHDRDRSRMVGDLSTWYVNVQHPAGSLDAAVANARGRNLLVSFG